MRPRFLVTLVSFLVLPSFHSQARAGDVIGNGAGLAETRFMYAYNNLQSFIGTCLSSKSCRLNPREQALAQKILLALPNERRAPEQLKFRTQAEENFEINGQIKVAKTGSAIGSPIYVNKDMIYEEDYDGARRAFTETEAVAVLVHEMGHHHGENDETVLDSLGTKVQALSETRLQRVEAGFLTANLVLTAINFNSYTSHAQLLMSDGVQVADLSPYVKAILQCRPGAQLVGSNLSNVHWRFPRQRLGRRGIWTLQARAWLVGFCTVGGTRLDRPHLRRGIGIDMNYYYDGTKWAYVPNSAKLSFLPE